MTQIYIGIAAQREPIAGAEKAEGAGREERVHKCRHPAKQLMWCERSGRVDSFLSDPTPGPMTD